MRARRFCGLDLPAAAQRRESATVGGGPTTAADAVIDDRTAEEVYQYSVEGACNGAIVVMHVGAQETADSLPAIIDELRARGYRLVTLGELLSPQEG